MNCDFLVLLFLGFADRDSNRDSVGENVSEILREVANYCKATLGSDRLTLLHPEKKYVDTSYQNHDNSYEMLGRLKPNNPKSSRRNEINIKQYSNMPVILGNTDLKQVLTNEEMRNTMVKIPMTAILNVISPDQLISLYQNNQAFDVPLSDPSAPRLIAMTGRVLASLIRGKNRFHNVIDHGVAGAENIFSGIHEAAGGVAEIIGGGAHGLLDLIG